MWPCNMHVTSTYMAVQYAPNISNLSKFMKPLNDCTDAELKQMKKLKDVKSITCAAEHASSNVYMMALATEKQKCVTAQRMDVAI